ncbi:MAG TPA: carboxypeptidase-like regulatory domain-containing protein [Thermoanaerobaculia bacterium]
MASGLGNLYGTVSDGEGGKLPGATALLSGLGAPQVQTTNAQGQFRFLDLPYGTYSVEVELEGFWTRDYPKVVIDSEDVQLEVILSPAT